MIPYPELTLGDYYLVFKKEFESKWEKLDKSYVQGYDFNYIPTKDICTMALVINGRRSDDINLAEHYFSNLKNLDVRKDVIQLIHTYFQEGVNYAGTVNDVLK